MDFGYFSWDCPVSGQVTSSLSESRGRHARWKGSVSCSKTFRHAAQLSPDLGFKPATFQSLTDLLYRLSCSHPHFTKPCEIFHTTVSHHWRGLKLIVMPYSHFPHSGSRCDQCAPGYYGNPEQPGGQCVPCECNGNIDTQDPGSCDPNTGQCLKCLYHTDGPSCNSCQHGYYGNALAHDCRRKCCFQLWR